MDRRLRQTERIYKEAPTAENQAQWMKELVRSGLLDEEKILRAAYLRHKPSMICGRGLGFVKPAGVIYNETLIVNRENIPLCRGLKHFDIYFSLRAAIGVLRLILRELKEPTASMRRALEAVEERVLNNRTILMERIYTRTIIRRYGRRINLQNSFWNIARRIQIERCTGPSLLAVSVFLNDLEFVEALQEETLSWLLGEYL